MVAPTLFDLVKRDKAGHQRHGQCLNGKLTPEYRTWRGILRRCYGKTNSGYKNYGAKGVTVCDRWRFSFTFFLMDMGNRPSEKHTIERKDGTKDYSPDNCRWATMYEQNRNKCNNVVITWRGKTQIAADWEKETGIHRHTIARRFRRGQTSDQIFDPACYRRWLSTRGKAKLSESQVNEIRELREHGVRVVTLAKRFGVQRNAIYAIILKQTWKHMPVKL